MHGPAERHRPLRVSGDAASDSVWVDPHRAGVSLIWRIVTVGALAPVGMMIASIPTGIFGGDDPNVTAQAIVMTIELVALWLYGGATLIRPWRQSEAGTAEASPFLRVFPAVYLAVFAVRAGRPVRDATAGRATSDSPK